MSAWRGGAWRVKSWQENSWLGWLYPVIPPVVVVTPSLANGLWVNAQAASQIISARVDVAYAKYKQENPVYELGEGSPQPGTFTTNGNLPRN